MAGKIITREWTSRGPLNRKVRHTAYGYDVTINGQRERKFSAEWQSENDALEALLKRQRDAEAGRPSPATRTLAELVGEYLRYKADRGKRSLREDTRILKRGILPAFGADLPVRKLTGAAIAQYDRQRAGQVSAFTVANELTVLRHMLRLARKWGYIEQVPEIEMPKKPEGRRRFLDESEITNLVAACGKSRNPYLSCIVTVAINTGMRKGEILGLEWERVNLSSARITLYETKGGAPRGVPINRAVYDALIALQPSADRRTYLVFKRHDGGAWGQIRTAFATALRNAGIAGFRFHDLRHTAASHMVMRGASLKEVQEVLGHKDFKMTLRYAHLSPAHLRAAVDRLDGLTSTKQGQGAEPAVPSPSAV
jgi:integrase